MNLAVLSLKNATRNKVRTFLTIAGVAMAVVAFVLLRTIIYSWTIAAEVASKDRLVTRHKITFVMTMPLRYVEDIKQVPGVKQVTWANWFGGKDMAHENEFFATLACDPKTTLEVYDEVQVDPAQKEAWIANRQGALVGDVLAKKMGWKVGQKVTLSGTIYPGEWQFEISGIYTATRKTVDRSTFWFHWDYMNEGIKRAQQKDQIGWIVARVDDPSKTADLSKKIDAMFEEKETPTLTQDERSFNTSWLGMFSAILRAIDVISIVILGIMLLILGNTIAMGARERVAEYGTMRAIGFLPRHIGAYVLGEGVIIGLFSGIAGLALAYPLVEKGLGRALEENMGGFFPYFRISTPTAVAAVLLPLVLGIGAALWPAMRAMKLNVVDALRRVG
jgi:putative ABC transport system permease protein